MVNYFYDSYQILNKVYSEKKFVKQAINETFIEELNRSITVKICYGVLDKDIELSYYIKSLAPKTPKLVIRTILKISMYAVKYLQKKDYFVVKNAVELTKKLGKDGASGFVNAFLRKFLSTEITLPDDETERLSVEYSYPEFAVKRLIGDYGKDKAIKIISAVPPENTLCFYETDGKDYLTKLGVEYSDTPFKNVFTVKNFKRNADYDKGVYTYQALGSVAICEIVEPCESLLDCCAAPGGKSVRLSYKIKNITSFDVYAHRVELINDYAFRMKRDNICAVLNDATVYDPTLNSNFDAVLCDAPCSGLGVAGDDPDIKINRTEENVFELCALQQKILGTVCNYVKPGGYLYYSTCSVFKDENIGAVEKFLKAHNNFCIEKINSALNHVDFNGTNAFLPDITQGNGFYVAKLKRIN